jgi:uncharacterized protein DUF6923
VRHLHVVSTFAVCALGASLAQAQTLLGVRRVAADAGRQLVYLDPATGGVTAPGPSIDPPLGSGSGVTSVDRAGNRLFLLGTTGVEADQRVWTIDLQTGTVITNPSLPGSASAAFLALEWDEGEGALFGLRNPGDGGKQLARIDPATGAITPIGSSIHPSPVGLGVSGGVNALDASGNRFFFVGLRLDDFVSRLYVVDTATGAFTEPTIPSGDVNPVSGLEWDVSEGVLYAIRNPGGGARQLATIDPATGVVTPLGTGTGVSTGTSGGVNALDEAGNRFFIVGTPAGDTDARLYTFDTADGSIDAQPTIVGSATEFYVGIDWESTPLPVRLLELTVE